jgi:hypothetical protein
LKFDEPLTLLRRCDEGDIRPISVETDTSDLPL